MGATAAVVGIGLSAYGTYSGLRAAKTQARHQADIDRMNAELRKQQIPEVIARGKEGERRLEVEGIQFAGEQVSAFASGNIDISSQVVSEAIEGTAKSTAADVVRLQKNTAKDVWALEVGIASDLAAAQLAERKAKSAKRASLIQPVAQLLTGFGGLAIKRSPVDVSGGGNA